MRVRADVDRRSAPRCEWMRLRRENVVEVGLMFCVDIREHRSVGEGLSEECSEVDERF